MLLENISVGDAPSHVMTNPVDDFVYVAINGANDDESVVELAPGSLNQTAELDIGAPHPHGHWISADGTTMVTPNQFTDDDMRTEMVEVQQSLRQADTPLEPL